MKRFSLLFLGLMSSAALAHYNRCGLNLSKTFFGQIKAPSESLKFMKFQNDRDYLAQLKALRLTANRNFIIHVTRMFRLDEGLLPNESVPVDFKGKMYFVTRTKGLTITDLAGDTIFDWPTFGEVRGRYKNVVESFRPSSRRIFTWLKMKNQDVAISVFINFLRLRLDQDREVPALDLEIRARLIYLHWLDTTIQSAEHQVRTNGT